MKFPAPVLIGSMALLVSAMSGADTLTDIYELALENDAQLKAQQAQYKANLETERLGLSRLLPQVNASYDYTRTDTDTDAESIDFNEDTGAFEPIDTFSNVDVDRDGYQVSLNQAIFDLQVPERVAVNDAGHSMTALANREVGRKCRGAGRAYKPTEPDNREQH